MNFKIVLTISALVLLSGLSFGALSDASEGDGPVTVTDGTGRNFEYSEPARYVVTMGYASTLTVAMLGEIDKIIATDMYSTYEQSKDERLKDLNAANLGSIYASSNNSYVLTWLLQKA
ncbi:MAG: hypothetical protein LBH88_00935, partial [Candidatus Methanoplasma sp.]|nr:hypothetical protein [Candidatus Methanoplasma sp.]